MGPLFFRTRSLTKPADASFSRPPPSVRTRILSRDAIVPGSPPRPASPAPHPQSLDVSVDDCPRASRDKKLRRELAGSDVAVIASHPAVRSMLYRFYEASLSA
ncbi:hypothetical protein NL676_005644 [Syzygium grande]|nr:hypothetical protein NL676_005644 [Syzygium grande]